MIINFKVPDQIFEDYVKQYGIPQCYQAMRRHIEEMKDYNIKDRYFVVFGDVRRAIEAVFGTTIENGEKLLKLIKNLNSVKISGVEVNFTEDEMARLAMQATFHGRSTEVYIKEMITELKDKMLEKV